MLAGRSKPPPPLINDEEDQYELEDVLDSKVDGRIVKYMVRWSGYGPDDITWEPWGNMVGELAKEKIREFHRRYPLKL